jgi:hypothetical protein
MRRTNTPTGAKFTVRGQIYIQTGAFYHAMGNGREVRVLELRTTCPECSDDFQATASMRQISTRQLVRRCPSCRKIHFGPVLAAPTPVRARKLTGKTLRKATTGRKRGTVQRQQIAVPPEAELDAARSAAGCFGSSRDAERAMRAVRAPTGDSLVRTSGNLAEGEKLNCVRR